MAAQAAADAKAGRSTSKTVTDTIVGEHEHTIVGYSLVKGIGDGEPIASERFTVGGHEWVLLFYPDGKRSSSSEGHLQPPGNAAQLVANPPPVANAAGPGHGAAAPAAVAPRAPADQAAGPPGAAARPAAPAPAPGNAAGNAVVPFANPAHPVPPVGVQGQPIAVQQGVRREQGAHNDYAALFVALIGEGDQPQGVVNTSEGRVVRAFHKFTLVDQSGGGQDLTKGRRREQGAVKISCARQDPNARNCHGYRKFVKRSVLESPQHGYLVNDTLVIRYTIELVVSSGGALSRNNSSGNAANKLTAPAISVPPPNIGSDLASLLESGHASDVVFRVEGETLRAHRIVLQARSPVFQALLGPEMREGKEGVVTIEDVRAPVFKVLLHFVYSDTLPEDVDGSNLDVALAQHLLVAADRYELTRLRRICEQRLCETVEVDTVATTLALAEQNHAQELKRVCLEFVSRNLSIVMGSEGYQHMVQSCPQLQDELLKTIAVNKEERTTGHRASRHHARPAADDAARHHARADDGNATDDSARRVRQRRE